MKPLPTEWLVKKSLFKARFMKPLHTHGAYQPILGFISIRVFFHSVSACGSKLRKRIEIMVYVPASFFGGVFLGTTRFLAIRQEGKINLGFSICCGRTSCVLVNLKCSCYDWCFFNITRFTKDHIWFLKQRGNWRAKLIRSLTKIFCWVDDNLTEFPWSNTTFLIVTPIPSMGHLPWWASL